MIGLTINGKPVQARLGETILSVAKKAGIRIPTLCHMEGLPPTGACRICVVEIGDQGRLVPSCSFPVSEGMRVQTHSLEALNARRTIVELLLAGHPDDCLYCVRNGECELQTLARELGIRQRRFRGNRNRFDLDVSSPSIVRDPEKCILCGKCVRVCEEIQGVAAIDFIGRGNGTSVGCAFNEGINVSSCVYCGQCITVCPTGALSEKVDTDRVLAALQDPDMVVVAQHAPSISVTLAEEFGMKPGKDIAGPLHAVLRMMGFDMVFDTSFSADLTVMEEATELVDRVRSGGVLPMLTSCSPGWIKFMEEFYPDLVGNLSTCRSPQQMMGAVIKSYWADQRGLDPKKVFSVAIMPCTAKKFEAGRPEMSRNGVPDVDAVLTTRELAGLIRAFGIDLASVDGEPADNPFGERSSAGKMFGSSGGVMEAAVRTAHFLITGRELKEPKIDSLRGEGTREVHLDAGGVELGVAVVSGLANARVILDRIRAGGSGLHFVEIMTCPGGCIAGGGQPTGADPALIAARLKALHRIDSTAPLRTAHGNRSVARLYREFLGEPCGPRSHTLLHTAYHGREVLK
jgi:iron-only hydrogenase group A